MHRGKDGHLTIEAGGPAGSGSADFFGAATRAAGRSGGGAKAPEPSREVHDQQVRSLVVTMLRSRGLYAKCIPGVYPTSWYSVQAFTALDYQQLLAGMSSARNALDSACVALELLRAPR